MKFLITYYRFIGWNRYGENYEQIGSPGELQDFATLEEAREYAKRNQPKGKGIFAQVDEYKEYKRVN